MTQDEREIMKEEIQEMMGVKHKNLVNVERVFETQSSFYVVFEYFGGVPMFDEIAKCPKFTEADAAFITKQILEGVAAAHEIDVCHKDLKPENILIDGEQAGALKIIDFGTATSQFLTLDLAPDQVFGSPFYAAPELIEGDYYQKTDIWSVGVILYVMLCGIPPFEGSSDFKIMSSIQQGEYLFDKLYWEDKSNQVKSFIMRCLQRNPEERPSAAEALEDFWIKRLSGADP